MGGSAGLVPSDYVNKIVSYKYLLISKKKTSALAQAIQKFGFGGSTWEGSGGVVSPNYVQAVAYAGFFNGGVQK